MAVGRVATPVAVGAWARPRPLLDARTQQPGLTGHVRWRAVVILLGATFALLAELIPPPVAGDAGILAGLTGGSYLVALGLWLAAPRLRRPIATGLTLGGSTLAAVAIGLALQRPREGATTIRLDRDVWLLLAIAIMLGTVALRRLFVELRTHMRLLDHLARTDPLTAVANRRAWEEELPRELARCRRDRARLCVALLDLDRFKAFNDMRGHQEGDWLLQHLAAAWRDTLRESDFIARYGGEEFAVLLRHCTLDHAGLLVERLRMVVPDEQTVSVGLASWDGSESAQELVARADEALYEAKAAGRDRVKISGHRLAGREEQPSRPWPAIVRQLLEERSVVAVYQPVVRITTGEVVGFEALARPNRDRLDISVEKMFLSAQRMGLERDLDWLCRRAALAGADWLSRGSALFLNVSASALLDPVHRVDQMLLVLAAVGRSPQELVLEITEREAIADLGRLRQVVSAYGRPAIPGRLSPAVGT